jgi:hypothetical protein
MPLAVWLSQRTMLLWLHLNTSFLGWSRNFLDLVIEEDAMYTQLLQSLLCAYVVNKNASLGNPVGCQCFAVVD